MKNQPFPIKPMTVGNILDYTFQVYRNNFAAIIGFSALISGVFGLLMLIVTQLLAPSGSMVNPVYQIIEGLKSGNFEDYVIESQTFEYGPNEIVQLLVMTLVVQLLALIQYIFVEPFVQGGIAGVTSKYYHGEKSDLTTALHTTWKKFGKLIATSLSLMIYYIVGVILFIIAVVILALPTVATVTWMNVTQSAGAIAAFIIILILDILAVIFLALTLQAFATFVYPIAASERIFHFNAISRSIKLVSKKFWKVLGVNILVALLVNVVVGSISGLAVVAAFVLPVTDVLQEVLTLLITALVTPIVYISATLLYYDARVRLEGYDMEMMAQGMEGNESWDYQLS